MKGKVVGLLILCLPVLFSSCKKESGVTTDAIVSVYGKTLTIDEINNILPDNYSSKDSADIIDRYIQEWINKELILQLARLNVGENPDIEQMVADYRNSLLVSKYTELLLDQKFKNEISEKDIADYYSNNQQSFMLNEQILSGIFFKIPFDAPNLDRLKNWYEKRSEDNMLELEDYCIQNAQIYEDFTNKWMATNRLNGYLPQALNTKSMRPGVTVEQADSLYRYYLLVFEARNQNDTAPLMFVRNQIEKALLHKNKLNYLASFKKDIYNEAIKNKNIIYYDKE